MTNLPVIKIFLSSPGDVAEERALAEIVFRRIGEEFADILQLSLVIWEHEPLFAHTGFQQQIERPSQCDLVVNILWSRLGTRLPSDFALVPGQPAPTGTEFEMQDALSSFSKSGKPHLLIYRKVPGPQIGLGSPDYTERIAQYSRLDEFCRRVFHNDDGAVVVAHSTFTDSHDFERRLAEHVRRWLDREIQSQHREEFRPLWRGKSPFRGLQSFEAEHQAIFFGRSAALGDLMHRIRETEAPAADPVARILLVQGMSGAGKTSLFKAGLLPLLDLRPVEGIARWLIVGIRPSESDPNMRDLGALAVLASRMAEQIPALARLGVSGQKLAETLRERPEEAAARIATCMAADADRAGLEPQRVRLLIYIDQLEEVFSLPDPGVAAESLMGAIVALARSGSMWVTATLRSDFVHRLEVYPDLMECLSPSPPYTLLPPRTDELAEMIREPARAAGLIWEQQRGIALDQELLADAARNPEALPLLEYTLAELYEKREGRMLRWSDYGGGLRDALISAADEVVSGSSGDVETAFRDTMRELVSVGEDGTATRRYAALDRFPKESGARALLDRLVARRLCVTTDQRRGDGPVACLAHEALIRSWPRAQEWLLRETALLRVRDEVARDAHVWLSHQRVDGWLGVSPEKIAAIDQVEQARLMPPGGATEYAQQSRKRFLRARGIRRTVATAICLSTVIAVVAAVIAVKQRDHARTEAETADRTKSFMVSLFKKADPSENRGNSVTVKEMLDIGAKEIRTRKGIDTLELEPQVRSELLTAMGEAYTGLGLFKPAEDLLSQAKIDDKSDVVSNESRIRTLVASGWTLYLAGQYDQSAADLRAGVDLARRSLAPTSEIRSEASADLAEALVQLGKFAEAKALAGEAIAAERKHGPEGAPILAQALTSLGKAYFYSGDPEAAEAPMREALALREQSLGRRHPLTAQSMENLGVDLYQMGRYDAAMQAYQQALPILREVYGPDHPEVATDLSDIGRSVLMTGNIDEAEPLLRQSLEMTRKFEGDDHDDLVSPLNSLAMIDAYRGHLDVALKEIQRADLIARQPDHDELLDQVLLNESEIEFELGDRVRAEALIEESKTQLAKAHPNNSANAWRYAVWDMIHAPMLAARGETQAARSTLDAAQTVIAKRFGTNGFYSLLATRRAQALAGASRDQNATKTSVAEQRN
jgi:tetratricopeptide (TPR) repeat protein